MPWSDVVVSDGEIPPLIIIMVLCLYKLDEVEDTMVSLFGKGREIREFFGAFLGYLIGNIISMIKYYVMQKISFISQFFMS